MAASSVSIEPAADADRYRLVCRTEQARLLLVLSYRSEELNTSACLRTLGALLLNAGSEDRRGAIDLEALEDDDVRALCRQRLPSDAPPDLVTRIVKEPRGKSLFSLQLLA
jgi:hypothetical protein